MKEMKNEELNIIFNLFTQVTFQLALRQLQGHLEQITYHKPFKA